ncbi:MAG TPA: cysteine-rich CWC family protein [Burkholderiaceae bacterium]|nr:cysteine-rich CWC family protein [Burkholderiaceae bacterium]
MKTSGDSPQARRCARCGADFICGAGGADPCWCSRLPLLPAARITSGEGCVCESCLRARLPAPETIR